MAQRGIKTNGLLSALSASDYALLEPHLSDLTVSHGTLLQDRGERIRHVYFPRSGMISLLVVMRSGEDVETTNVGREGAVNLMAGFGATKAPMRAVMQVPGVVTRIAAAQFQKSVRDSRSMAELLLRYADGMIAQAQQTAACNAVHTVEPRLCKWLLQTRDRIDSNTLPLTQEFLAQMLGVRRTTVTLAARNLQEHGLIRYRRGQIEILSPKGLQECACECYEAAHAFHGQIQPKRN
jgi:CRP-like cAMP-binding protein